MTASTLSWRANPSAALLGAVGFAAALALGSQVAVPLPGTPVPITLQPMIVVLAGLWLGPAGGAASMALYLLAGAAGLPVFAPMGAPGLARFFGPTGGYLIAYPFAAAAAGWVAARGAGRSVARNAAGALAGMLVIFAGGLAQLAVLTGSAERAAAVGLHPFALLDVAKVVLAALLAPRRGARAAG